VAAALWTFVPSTEFGNVYYLIRREADCAVDTRQEALRVAVGCTLLCALCGLLVSCGHMPNAQGAGDDQSIPQLVEQTDLSARTMARAEPSEKDNQSLKPLIFPGSEQDIETTPNKTSPNDGVPALQRASLTSAGVELNFEGADVQTVAKSLLGDILQLNFIVDSRVQAKITLASSEPIQRKDILPVFESALRMSNAAIVRDGNFIKIVPVAEANAPSSVSVGEGEIGFGISVIPLKYTSATTVARTLENFVARQGSIKVDASRNLLLIQGTTAERQSAIDVIAAFDVEWLRNRSVGIFPLKASAPESMITELDRIFESAEGGAGEGVVQFQPVGRMNAVMVVSKSPKVLASVSQWINRLDRSDNSGTTVRVYTVKYGNATQLAKVLTNVFVAHPTLDSSASQLAPNSKPVQARINALDQSTSPNTGTTPSTASSQSSPGRASSPIAAAFSSFSTKGDTKGQTQDQGNGSLSNDAGLFQDVRITADESNNSLIIYSNQEEYNLIERALRTVDRVQLQVSIDATIAEVDLTDQLQYGIQYYLTKGNFASLFSAAATAATTAASATNPVAAAIQPALPGFNLLLGNSAQPSFILSALSSITKVKVLSAPTLVAVDNQPALLQVGDEVPITTGSATVLSSSNTVVNTIEMRDTGVILKVLPHVHPNGTIDLEVEQEISSVDSTQQTGTLTPTIAERRIHSTVSVTSGQTVLLGGLISERNEADRSGLPIINQLNVLGDLLGATTKNKQRSELIVFVRPTLIRNSVDAGNVSREFRQRLEEMRPHKAIINGEAVFAK
jgi:general secretion pathway protein D